MSAFFHRSIVAIQLSRRSASFHALAMTAALLTAIVSTAQANTVVYSLTSIPNSNSVVHADNNNRSLTDTLSGTITVSSSQSIFGTWNSTNVPSSAITLSYDLSMSNSNVSDNNIMGNQDLATLISTNNVQGNGLTLTSSGIFVKKKYGRGPGLAARSRRNISNSALPRGVADLERKPAPHGQH